MPAWLGEGLLPDWQPVSSCCLHKVEGGRGWGPKSFSQGSPKPMSFLQLLTWSAYHFPVIDASISSLSSASAQASECPLPCSTDGHRLPLYCCQQLLKPSSPFLSLTARELCLFFFSHSYANYSPLPAFTIKWRTSTSALAHTYWPTQRYTSSYLCIITPYAVT